MATDSPKLCDGAQCVAAANYWNPTTALKGPGGSGQYLAVYVSASRTVTIQTTDTGAFYGVLQNTPTLGQVAEVAIEGISKMVAGDAITVGAELMMDSNGCFIPWVGSTKTKVGLALEAAAQYQVFVGKIYPTPYKTLS